MHDKGNYTLPTWLLKGPLRCIRSSKCRCIQRHARCLTCFFFFFGYCIPSCFISVKARWLLLHDSIRARLQMLEFMFEILDVVFPRSAFLLIHWTFISFAEEIPIITYGVVLLHALY